MWSAQQIIRRQFSTSQSLLQKVAGRYKVTKNKSKMLTYEQANGPHQIAHRKAWTSWNTSGLKDGLRTAETTMEDLFIRKFLQGTFHNMFASEVLIKRRHNVIYIAGIIDRMLIPRKVYFLIGYTEELLSYILKCPIKLELQTTTNKSDLAFKYI